MENTQERLPEVNTLEAEAFRAVQAGREEDAFRLWNRILELDPGHSRTLTAIGQRSFRRGDMASARVAFQRLVDADGSDAQQWIHLAIACRNLGDEPAEEAAIRRALETDPSDLVGLILRANFLERKGKTHEAARAYGAVASVAPPLDRLRPELRPAVSEAYAHVEKYNREFGAFLDQHLDSLLRNFAGEKLGRFRDSVDIMVGRKRRYDSQSITYHYPQLAAIEFFDRAEFPWLEGIEAATDAIRDEFLAVLAAEEGFTPYISYPDDVPQNQFAELNNSPRWSAFHLHKMGKLIAENAAKCPLTMKALEAVPQPDQPGRTPASMFSLLKPRTRIPPHTGVTNVRLVTHVPLIIPADCGFRVGNDTRQWVPGTAWVFDDTIEHEAWNNSNQLRVVFIFDVWHPHLTPPERAMVTALMAGINAFQGEAAGTAET
jgi:aspartyl/asparaginyl beta-hydroxylase (cupin superfamily)/cytochrome c-type biogenesis protein CcmH/NrfG